MTAAMAAIDPNEREPELLEMSGEDDELPTDLDMPDLISGSEVEHCDGMLDA